ncbi:MAG: regulatory protein RecX [Rikenellaceae bacterium]
MPKEFVIPKEKTYEQALNSLKRLCAKAEKSSGDALRLMYKWRVKDSDKQKILQELTASRFIDDNRYAQAFTREKINLSGWGVYKIKAALAAKGISRDIIEQTLSEVDSEKLTDNLKEKLQKKSRNISSTTLDVYKVREKLIRYGLSLGYELDQVKNIISQLDADS